MKRARLTALLALLVLLAAVAAGPAAAASRPNKKRPPRPNNKRGVGPTTTATTASRNNPPKVKLCKYVPGPPSKWNQIEVSVSAWKDGIAQGKYEKTCSITPGFARPCRKADCKDPWDCADGNSAELIAGNVCRCKAGFFGLNGAAPCQPCPAGSTSTPGSTECTCSDDSALINGKCQCKAMFYSAADGNWPCTPCPGISSSGPGSTECSCSGNSALVGSDCKCLAGFYGENGNYPCTKCPDGASSSIGSSACTCDSSNSQLVGTGSNAVCQCKAGFYGPNGNVPCERCPDGETSTPGSTSCLSSTTCTAAISPCTYTITSSNRDIYFTVNAVQTLTVRTYSNTDPMIWLYDSNDNLVAANDDWYGLQSSIVINLQPGTYRLRAGNCCGNPDYWAGTDYTLTASLAAPQMGRTPWKMHEGGLEPGAGSTSPFIVPAPCVPSSFGDPCLFSSAVVPVSGDAGWTSAPTSGYRLGAIEFYRSSNVPCLTAVDYTYFEAFFTVLPETTVSEFSISSFSVDDGARITIYNSASLSGTTVDVTGYTTGNLASLIAPGVNRIVITHVDSCASGSALYEGYFSVNGSPAVFGSF